MNIRDAIPLVAASLFSFGIGVAHAADTTVVVSPGDMRGWNFVNDGTGAVGSGDFVKGPATPPAGKGSVHFKLASDGNDRQIIGTKGYIGTKLSDITTLQYSTYRASEDAGNNLAISLQFDIRYRPTDTAYGGRLVYEPYQGAIDNDVPTGAWQTWNTLAGKWWASRTNGSGTNGYCAQDYPCSWQEVLNLFPEATINERLLLKAGGPWATFEGNADALKVGILGNTTTFDFERGPTNKDECKDGGFTGIYKNQGECVSFFARNGD